ncbi:MAG: alkaline phosphatase family protein [Bacillota bacterium]|nr:alkaline phosphatase family protein [Bacillota bacterium]
MHKKVIKKFSLALIIPALAFFVLVGCHLETKVQPFTIAGDVREVVEYSNSEVLSPLTIEGEKHNAVPLTAVMEAARPYGLSQITFIGADDHSATITVQDLEGSYLSWSSEEGWYFVSERYPINTHIKNIRQIIVQGEEAPGMAVIGEGQNFATITPGNLLSSSHRLRIYEEGSTGREYQGVTYEGKSLSRHVTRQVLELVPGMAKTVEAVGTDGSMHSLSLESYIEVRGNKIYLNRFDHTPPVELAGLIVNPPAGRITDLYSDVLNLVEDGHRVLVLMLDGFSYPLYEKAAEEQLAPNIMSGADVKKTISVFPPITPCGLTAMLTGKLPDENGVRSRDDRVPKVPSLLESLDERGKKGIIISGTIFPIQLDGEVSLTTDQNKNDSNDDEVYQKAIEYMDSDYDMVFVHFKDIDRSGHTYGPLADETCRSLAQIDRYVGELFAAWPGRRIILSDHGMHETEEGGHHGLFRHEDLYIPYLTYE